MADQIFFEERWCERPRPRSNRFLLMIIGVVLVVLIGEGIFQFVLAPNMRIRTIVVDNDLLLGREDLLSIAGLDAQPYYFSLDVDTVRRNLEAWPAVKSAFVEKVFPDSLRIITRGRQAVAVALAETGGGTVVLAVDEEGVVFETGPEVAALGLPVVSGIRFEGIRAGMRLPSMLKSLLEDLKALRGASPALFGSFSELRIVKKGDEHFEVILYPVHHRVPVRFEGHLTEERSKMILMVLDVMGREGLLDKVEEIDFRTGDIVYRFKEG